VAKQDEEVKEVAVETACLCVKFAPVPVNRTLKKKMLLSYASL